MYLRGWFESVNIQSVYAHGSKPCYVRLQFLSVLTREELVRGFEPASWHSVDRTEDEDETGVVGNDWPTNLRRRLVHLAAELFVGRRSNPHAILL